MTTYGDKYDQLPAENSDSDLDDYDASGGIRNQLLVSWLIAQQEARLKEKTRGMEIIKMVAWWGGLAFAAAVFRLWLAGNITNPGANVTAVIAMSHWGMAIICCAGIATKLVDEIKSVAVRSMIPSSGAGTLNRTIVFATIAFSAPLLLILAEGIYLLLLNLLA